MTLSIVFILVLLAILGFFVLSPLINNNAHGLVFQNFENEEDLRTLFAFRDALLAKLLAAETENTQHQEGDPGNAAHGSESSFLESWKKAAELSESEAFEALVRVCRVLKRAGIPHLPAAASLSATVQSSAAATAKPLVVLLAGLLAAGGAAAGLHEFLNGQKALAQEAPQSSMPGLNVLEDGTALTQIHQFVLSPDQGQLRVFYLALFNAQSETQIKLRIPSPDDATDFDFSGMNEATLEPVQKTAGQPAPPPVLNIPAKAGINQIQGSFIVPAPTGSLNWSSSFFKTLPGVVLIILPEYHDFLSALLGGALTGLNIWPPHLKIAPEGFEFKRSKEQPNDRDPNFARMKNPPDQYSFHYFRRGEKTAPYPEFVLHGLAPVRLPMLLLVVTFGFVLAGVAVFTGLKSRKAS